MTNTEAISVLMEQADYLYGADYPHDREAFDLAIAALERDRWISVKKEMPAPQQVVLCRFKNGKCAVCFWGNYKWNDVNDFSEYIAVTHWRPLPEPLKEDKP